MEKKKKKIKERPGEGKNLCFRSGNRLFYTDAEVIQLWVTIDPIQVDWNLHRLLH